MPGLADCLSFLRLLIARGDPKGIPLAMSAIDDYLAMAPASARSRGLRVLQQDALELHVSSVGVQRRLRRRLTPISSGSWRRSEAPRPRAAELSRAA